MFFNSAILAIYAVVGMAISIARLLVLRKALKILLMNLSELVPEHIRVTSAPQRSGSWEVEFGTLGKYLRGKTTFTVDADCVITSWYPLDC